MNTGKILLFQSLRNGGTAGRYNESGLPGITGRFDGQGDRTGFIGPSGAFYGIGPNSWMAGGLGGTDAAYFVTVGLDASRCSTIYGASDTVMPASIDIAVGLYLGRTA